MMGDYVLPRASKRDEPLQDSLSALVAQHFAVQRFSDFRAEDLSEVQESVVQRRASAPNAKYVMRIDEITQPKRVQTRPRLKPIKPSTKTLPSIEPQNAAQGMIAAKRRDVETARQALKREKAFQKRHRELEKQRKAWAKR